MTLCSPFRRMLLLALVSGAAGAVSLPAAAQCEPGAGSCCEVRLTSPGCDDVDCCTTVCTTDPFCCDIFWDTICVERALEDCLDTDMDGTPDACEAAPVNLAPTADAACEQLTNIGSGAVLRLDGSGSTDPEGAALSYQWTIINLETTDQLEPTGAVVEVELAFGSYSVTLRVTDPGGAFDEDAKTIALDPATLSSLDLDRVKVRWDRDPVEVEIRGEIGLPAAVDFEELDPLIEVAVELAGSPLLEGVTVVLFDAEGADGRKWRFDDPAASTGIRRFDVDWKGSRFDFKAPGFPVKLKSLVITSGQTVLEMKLKAKDIDGPFTVDFDGQGSLDLDGDGAVLGASNLTVEVEKPGKELTLTLGFPLTDAAVIEFSGALVRTVAVGDDLKESVGRYRLDLEVDPADFPDGALTLPRTIDVELFVGGQGYPGTVSLGEDDLEVKGESWRAD